MEVHISDIQYCVHASQQVSQPVSLSVCWIEPSRFNVERRPSRNVGAGMLQMECRSASLGIGTEMRRATEAGCACKGQATRQMHTLSVHEHRHAPYSVERTNWLGSRKLCRACRTGDAPLAFVTHRELEPAPTTCARSPQKSTSSTQARH